MIHNNSKITESHKAIACPRSTSYGSRRGMAGRVPVMTATSIAADNHISSSSSVSISILSSSLIPSR